MRRKRPILKLRHDILRRDVSFTDANDHNPTIFEDCPECRGTGRRGESSENEHISYRCEVCGGTGHGRERVPYFDNDAPMIDVAVGVDGWLTCPCCRWRFKLSDERVWTGRRHVRCGQKIRPTMGNAKGT